MAAVGVAEDNIFKKRKEDDVRFLQLHTAIVRLLAQKKKSLYKLNNIKWYQASVLFDAG